MIDNDNDFEQLRDEDRSSLQPLTIGFRNPLNLDVQLVELVDGWKDDKGHYWGPGEPVWKCNHDALLRFNRPDDEHGLPFVRAASKEIAVLRFTMRVAAMPQGEADV